MINNYRKNCLLITTVCLMVWAVGCALIAENAVDSRVLPVRTIKVAIATDHSGAVVAEFVKVSAEWGQKYGIRFEIVDIVVHDFGINSRYMDGALFALHKALKDADYEIGIGYDYEWSYYLAHFGIVWLGVTDLGFSGRQARHIFMRNIDCLDHELEHLFIGPHGSEWGSILDNKWREFKRVGE